jgi:hypothetical protein
MMIYPVAAASDGGKPKLLDHVRQLLRIARLQAPGGRRSAPAIRDPSSSRATAITVRVLNALSRTLIAIRPPSKRD